MNDLKIQLRLEDSMMAGYGFTWKSSNHLEIIHRLDFEGRKDHIFLKTNDSS